MRSEPHTSERGMSKNNLSDPTHYRKPSSFTQKVISSIMYEEKASIGGRRDIISLKSGDLFLRFLGLTQERQSALNLLKKNVHIHLHQRL